MKKNVLSTSLRSATQATDSTWRGWTANRAATKALRQTAPVMRRSRKKSRSVLARWNSRLVRWWPTGFKPKSWTSSMWESHVTGCQLLAWPARNAQVIFSQVNPVRTWMFSVT